MKDAIISEIQIVPIKPKDGLVGFVSFVLNGWFYLGSIGIYTRLDGNYRLTYPTKDSRNIFYPINREISDAIEKQVIIKFEEVTKPYDRHYKVDSR
ncbi:MAG: hypothetical protein ACD_57C00224G0002 [uncultured bacterium]|nr:MAG: hypothetical protein ACD_57C00224G0002 [uncultured bacterium]